MTRALTILAGFVPLCSLSSVAQPQRVVAVVSVGQPAFSDSVRYFYSGGRGSVFNYDFMEYDHGYREFGSPDNWRAENLLYPDRAPQVRCDGWTRWTGSSFSDTSESGNIAYNGTGSVTEHITRLIESDGYTTAYSPRYTALYDAAGQRTQSTRWRWDGGPWQSPTTRYIRYDALGRMLADSVGNNLEYYYEYGSLDKPDAVLYRKMIVPNYYATHQTYLLRYYPDSLVSSIVSYLSGSSITMPSSVDSFHYYPGTRYIQNWLHYEDGGSTLTCVVRKHINPQNNLPDTILRLLKSPVFPPTWDTTLTIFTYNNHDNPELSRSYRLTNGVWGTTPYETRRFYYENYDPAGVAGASTPGQSPILYPNPAQDVVRLRYDGATADAVVKLYDLHGRTIMRAQLQMQGEAELSLKGIPPSVYFYQVFANGRAVAHGKVIKR